MAAVSTQVFSEAACADLEAAICSPAEAQHAEGAFSGRGSGGIGAYGGYGGYGGYSYGYPAYGYQICAYDDWGNPVPCSAYSRRLLTLDASAVILKAPSAPEALDDRPRFNSASPHPRAFPSFRFSWLRGFRVACCLCRLRAAA